MGLDKRGGGTERERARRRRGVQGRSGRAGRQRRCHGRRPVRGGPSAVIPRAVDGHLRGRGGRGGSHGGLRAVLAGADLAQLERGKDGGERRVVHDESHGEVARGVQLLHGALQLLHHPVQLALLLQRATRSEVDCLSLSHSATDSEVDCLSLSHSATDM